MENIKLTAVTKEKKLSIIRETD